MRIWNGWPLDTKPAASQKGLAHKIAFPGPEALQLSGPLNQNLVLAFIPNWRLCKGYKNLLRMGVICFH